jgi:hypothetical protein
MPCDEWAWLTKGHLFLQNIFSGFCLPGAMTRRVAKGPERGPLSPHGPFCQDFEDI